VNGRDGSHAAVIILESFNMSVRLHAGGYQFRMSAMNEILALRIRKFRIAIASQQARCEAAALWLSQTRAALSAHGPLAGDAKRQLTIAEVQGRMRLLTEAADKVTEAHARLAKMTKELRELEDEQNRR
jgi:hypothetical protein